MPYDGEHYVEPTPPKHNVDRLIERLQQISDRNYQWTNPWNCVIGHTQGLMAVERGCERLYITPKAAFDWLGLSPGDGERIYLGNWGASHLRTRCDAIKHLQRLIKRGLIAGYPAPVRRSFLQRLFRR